jgi:hypothetical protein
MKINLMNVAGRLRYGYLTDSQAQGKGMNLTELKKLRSIKDRAETVYWQAGGKKENLKKAILQGNGNKDRNVPLSGLGGLSDVYADQDEYNIIHSDNIEGLGELASGAAIAAATTAVAAIAGALKQVKGLFIKGGSNEKSFQSDTDNAGTTASVPSMIPEDEDAFKYDSYVVPPVTQQQPTLVSKLTTAVKSIVTSPNIASKQIVTATSPTTSTQTPTRSYAPAPSVPATTIKTNETTKIYSAPAPITKPVLSNEPTASGSMLVPDESTTPGDAIQTQDGSEKAGIVQKTTTWVKANPGKSLLVAGGIITGGLLLMRAMRGGSGTNGLSGLPAKRKTKKRKHKNRKVSGKKSKVKFQNLL